MVAVPPACAGLVRFASEQYSTERTSLKNATMHLTNYSINKTAKTSQQPSSSSAATVSSAQPQQSCPQDPVSTTDLLHDSAGESGATGQQQHSAGEEVPAAGCCKWSFGQLAAYFESQGHDWPHVWDQVGAAACVDHSRAACWSARLQSLCPWLQQHVQGFRKLNQAVPFATSATVAAAGVQDLCTDSDSNRACTAQHYSQYRRPQLDEELLRSVWV